MKLTAINPKGKTTKAKTVNPTVKRPKATKATPPPAPPPEPPHPHAPTKPSVHTQRARASIEKNGKRIQRGVIITPADLDRALDMIANEQASETKVAAKFGISRGKLSDLLNATAELTHRYARAREARAEMFVDECIQIADNASGFKDGVAKARLQTDMRMKYASKMFPERFGERLAVQHDASKQLLAMFVSSVNEAGKTPPGYEGGN